jgi:hypothetical protein
VQQQQGAQQGAMLSGLSPHHAQPLPAHGLAPDVSSASVGAAGGGS